MTTAAEFFVEHGRLPQLDDDPPPWSYRGFLLPYVQAIHAECSEVPDRWGYLARTIEAGEFLDDPIPEVRFFSCSSSRAREGMKVLEQWHAILSLRHGAWTALQVLVCWLSWGLGTTDDPKTEADDEESRRLYQEVDLGIWLRTPADYLGTFLGERKGGGKVWNPTAFYATPVDMCRVIVELSLAADVEGLADQRAASVHDPCCGTGRLLLEASNRSMNLSGQDIDWFVLEILKINAALFAPWIVAPLPASILDAARS